MSNDSRNPYVVFINTLQKELDMLKFFIESEKIGPNIDISIAKISGICELFYDLFKSGCIPEKSFSKMKKSIAIRMQKLIDICPEDKDYSQDLYYNMQNLLDRWRKGNIGKWEFIEVLPEEK